MVHSPKPITHSSQLHFPAPLLLELYFELSSAYATQLSTISSAMSSNVFFIRKPFFLKSAYFLVRACILLCAVAFILLSGHLIIKNWLYNLSASLLSFKASFDAARK